MKAQKIARVVWAFHPLIRLIENVKTGTMKPAICLDRVEKFELNYNLQTVHSLAELLGKQPMMVCYYKVQPIRLICLSQLNFKL